MVFDEEPVVVKSGRYSVGKRVQVFRPGNELGKLGEIEDVLREGDAELPEDGRIDPRNEVFQILATRTIEVERCKRTEHNTIVGERGRTCTSTD